MAIENCIKANDSRGFLALSLTLFLTIASTLFAAAFTYKIMTFKNRQQFNCQKSLLDTQTSQAKLLRHLLNLNPVALSLRKKRKIATRVRNAARSNPPALAAAQLALEIIKAQQRALRAKQNHIILQSSLAWGKLRLKLASSKPNQRARLTHPQKLAVIKQPDRWGSPTYKPSPSLEQLQISSLTWAYDVKIESAAISKALKQNSIRLHIACGTTLKRRRSKWVPILHNPGKA